MAGLITLVWPVCYRVWVYTRQEKKPEFHFTPSQDRLKAGFYDMEFRERAHDLFSVTSGKLFSGVHWPSDLRLLLALPRI